MAVLVVLVLAVAVAGRAADGEGFSDLGEGGVHRPAIDALDAAGVFAGTECAAGRFCPEDPIPRWVVAVWLVRVLDDGALPPGVGVSSFADVDEGLWWAPFVERLAALEVTAGCGVDPLRFCPDDPVTRAQMATFLTRAFSLEPGPPAGFEDVAGGVHSGSIDALSALEVTAGCGVDPLRYCPDEPVSRGQMATFIARAEGLVPLPGTVQSYRIGFTRQHLPVDRVYVMSSNGAYQRQLVPEGSGWGAVWSPDSTRIAFTGEHGSETASRIFVVDPYYGNEAQDLGIGYSPVWSPDGTRLAFSSFGESAIDVLVMDVDGTGRRKLAVGQDPAWSPDGLSIAFTRTVEGVDGVFVIGVDGTGERYLGEGSGPVWSPDGMEVAFTRAVDGGDDLFVMNSDGSDQRQLTHADGNDRNPAWSPDGERIAFDSERDSDLSEETPDSDIYVMNADGSDQRRLTDGGVRNYRPVWSPDGVRIAYTSHEWRYFYIYSINADGSDRQRLTYTSDDRDPVWSPDGWSIAFTSDREGNYLSLVTEIDGTDQSRVVDTGPGAPVWSPGGAHIAFSCCPGYLGYISVVDTGEAGFGRRLAETAGTDWGRDPVWSPDGTRLAFTNSRTADNELGFVEEIFHIDKDGTNLTQLTHTEGGAYGASRPVWSPDGTRVAFLRSRDLDPAPTVSNIDTELLVVNTDGTDQRQVAQTYGDDHNPVWSPDGTRIAFHHSTQSTTKILVVNADGSDQRILARTRGEEWGPRWSPDGTRIAFTGIATRGGVPSVFVVNADGTDQRNLTFGAGPRWSPDGTSIAFVDYGDTGFTFEIVHANPDGTNQRLLTRTGPETAPSGLVWSPDGSRIAFSSTHDGDDEIYVVNADGTGQTQLTDNTFFADSDPVWLPG